MKLSTRSQYGLRALLDIVLHQKEGPVPLKDIAYRQQVSASYLDHVIVRLIEGGMVQSSRGIGGGVWLIKSPQDIKLSEVIALLEGSIAPVKCVDDANACNRSEFCVTRDIWGELKEAMDGVLKSTTLQDLVERQRDKTPPMYYI